MIGKHHQYLMPLSLLGHCYQIVKDEKNEDDIHREYKICFLEKVIVICSSTKIKEHLGFRGFILVILFGLSLTFNIFC